MGGRGENYRRLMQFIPLIALFTLISITAVDAAAHLLTPYRTGCKIEVFDAYGFADPKIAGQYYRGGLDMWTFRSLGKTDAEVIVVITHFFSSSNPSMVGLGVSDEPSFLFALTHPASSFFIVKGRTNEGEEKVAASPRIMAISSRLDGKVIILLTCKLPGIEEFAKAFLDAGARKVLVSNTPFLDTDDVNMLLKKVLNAKSVDDLCSYGFFSCYG